MIKKIWGLWRGGDLPDTPPVDPDFRPTVPPAVSPATAALMRLIEERSAEDPLIGAKLGAKEVLERLLRVMATGQGVHIESLLCALGALAGYACQANLRGQALALGVAETAALTTVELADGQRFYFGDPLNQLLFESPQSVWGLAAGMAQHLGTEPSLDVPAIFEHVAGTLGEPDFGCPRVPAGHQPGDLPAHYLRALWPTLLPTLKRFCARPNDWHLLYGLAIQQAMELGREALDPELALALVMESAIPMSHVDFAALQATQH